jgi:predicted metallopeptidase
VAGGRVDQQAVGVGFDFTAQIRGVCADMVARLPDLAHIDLERVAFSFSQARRPGPYGLHASLTPMRFAGGARVERRGGRYYRSQSLLDERGRERLYILTFCLPRFMNLDFREKLVTILHELWHISPLFDGDLRRHEGRCYAHSASREGYDARMRALADRWLALAPPPPLYEFLRSDFTQLLHRHGRIFGTRITRPKLIPISRPDHHP